MNGFLKMKAMTAEYRTKALTVGQTYARKSSEFAQR